MDAFERFLHDVGLLHDCVVTRFEWNKAAGTVAFDIEDIFFNFEGLTEYPGPTPGQILLSGVRSVAVEIPVREERLDISMILRCSAKTEMTGLSK